MDSFLEIVEINDIKYNISGNRKFYAFSFDEYQRERERERERSGGCRPRKPDVSRDPVARFVSLLLVAKL